MSIEESSRKGHVYILSNASHIGFYTVGCTSGNLERVVSELSKDAGEPTPYIIEYSEKFNHCADALEYIYKLLELAGGKTTENKGLFQLPLEKVIETVDYIKKLLDSNIDAKDSSEEKSQFPESKVYIEQAKVILENERLFGGEKKAELNLIEAAKLGDPEAYFLLGVLYLNPHFENLYDFDRASDMYLQVIQREELVYVLSLPNLLYG